jgi:threonylcarbamoyladenosine tRNA methylthiotransferase MtaB
MKRKVAFKTLGCRLNQFETDAIVTDFFRSGYEIVRFTDQADVYVINTCTVTNQGDHKSKTAINQAIRTAREGLVVVTGCMAENQESWLKEQGDIAYVVDNRHKSRILTLVEAHYNGEIVAPDLLDSDVFSFSVAEKSLHTRSMIKIQDGCDNFCTFCIVPMVRGRAVSRPAVSIVENIHEVIRLGYKEIVLTGVNISRYDHEGVDFTGLLKKILNISGDFRVRISSVEPEGYGTAFFDMFSNPKLCPNLHLCLQSGSDRILAEMRRTYKLSSYLKIVEELRRRMPLFNFTTDVMVGFPGETEADFRETCNVIKQVGFSHVHTFKYSVRKGTRAEIMPGHLPESVKHERSLIVRKLAAECKLAYRKSFIGRQQIVLVEKVNKNGMAHGYGEHYVPVEFKATQPGKNYFEIVTINSVAPESHDFVLRGR